MPLGIEDYALIGDRRSGALVGVDGSIDWLCLPRFDSPSLFGALLGYGEHGEWRLRPADARMVLTKREYVEGTVVLRSTWSGPEGAVTVHDAMVVHDGRSHVVRRVEGLSGRVRMRGEVAIRFGYATAIPWLRQVPEAGGNAIVATAGPDSVVVRGPHMRADGRRHLSEFDVAAGERVDHVLTWFPSHEDLPDPIDVDAELGTTISDWRRWVGQADVPELFGDEVRRSLLTLRALTFRETGGIVAALTTSLPESFGGVRNWDYRYVWLRDASLTLGSLLQHGLTREASRWRNWLLRTVAGDPADIQIMYGLAGERSLPEAEIVSLPGYRGAGPVRIGNGAAEQYQADVFGELFIALRAARRNGVHEDGYSWNLQRAILRHLEDRWEALDRGMWEVRGAPRAFTYSRVMLWAAFQCGVEAVEEGHDGPVDRWRRIRDRLRDEIERHAVDPATGSFVQYYGADVVDANLLLLADCGFVAPDDPRMLATVDRIERELVRGGLVLRYDATSGVDGLPGDEHPFLACSFWLVEQYARSGRHDDAVALMRRVLSCANDVGLLSEEYDVDGHRQAGNTPQAFTHLALIRAAAAIATPDEDRIDRLGGAA